MKVRFVHYLHDDDEGVSESILKQMPSEVQEEYPLGPDGDFNPDFADLIGRPFYEVKVECELDTETGEVTLLRATL